MTADQDQLVITGPHTGRSLTVLQVDGVWTCRDERGRGPSLGNSLNRHATPEAARERAIEDDLIAAASGGPLTREQYETEAARLGLETLADSECDAYGVLYGDYSRPTYTHVKAATMRLARRRLAGMPKDEPTSIDVADAPTCKRCGGSSPQTTIGGGICDDCV